MPKKLQSSDDDLMKICWNTMPSCGVSTPNMRTPCTRSNAMSRACKAGSINSKNSTNNSPRNAISF